MIHGKDLIPGEIYVLWQSDGFRVVRPLSGETYYLNYKKPFLVVEKVNVYFQSKNRYTTYKVIVDCSVAWIDFLSTDLLLTLEEYLNFKF